MMNPNFTSYLAQSRREDLQREALRERQAAEALAREPCEAVDQPRLVTRLIATVQAFLRVAGKTAPAEGR